MLSLEDAIQRVTEVIGGKPVIYAESNDEFVFCFGDPSFLESINKDTGEHKSISMSGLSVAPIIGKEFGLSDDEIAKASLDYEKYSKMFDEAKPL